MYIIMQVDNVPRFSFVVEMCMLKCYGHNLSKEGHVCVTGWTTTRCPDEEQLKALGDTMSENIKAVHGKSYTNQRIIDLYKATGGASDWLGL